MKNNKNHVTKLLKYNKIQGWILAIWLAGAFLSTTCMDGCFLWIGWRRQQLIIPKSSPFHHRKWILRTVNCSLNSFVIHDLLRLTAYLLLFTISYYSFEYQFFLLKTNDVMNRLIFYYRFSFYGLRTVLMIYLTNYLAFESGRAILSPYLYYVCLFLSTCWYLLFNVIVILLLRNILLVEYCRTRTLANSKLYFTCLSFIPLATSFYQLLLYQESQEEIQPAHLLFRLIGGEWPLD